VAAAVIGIVATLFLRRSRFGKSERRDATGDPNVNLDIGQTLNVDTWSGGDGGPSTARVMYRGALWDVELAPHEVARPGVFVIGQVHGNRLIVAPHVTNNNQQERKDA
jgi:membrane protein implicated in regulation of membrane protease activity